MRPYATGNTTVLTICYELAWSTVIDNLTGTGHESDRIRSVDKEDTVVTTEST